MYHHEGFFTVSWSTAAATLTDRALFSVLSLRIGAPTPRRYTALENFRFASRSDNGLRFYLNSLGQTSHVQNGLLSREWKNTFLLGWKPLLTFPYCIYDEQSTISNFSDLKC